MFSKVMLGRRAPDRPAVFLAMSVDEVSCIAAKPSVPGAIVRRVPAHNLLRVNRPGIAGGPNVQGDGAAGMKHMPQHSPKVRQRAVRMVMERGAEHTSPLAATVSIAAKIVVRGRRCTTGWRRMNEIAALGPVCRPHRPNEERRPFRNAAHLLAVGWGSGPRLNRGG